MKVILISLMKAFLNVCYFFMKAFSKEQNRIVYLSRQSNEKSIDMKLLETALNEICPDTQQVFRLKMIDDGLSAKIKYFGYVLGDLKIIATSRVAILDTYSIAISCCKHRESLKVIQMWHALGAIKKFSLQSLGTEDGRDEKISKCMNMHKNYDYIFAPSKETAKIYMEAFGYPAKNMKISSLPRVDYLLSDGAEVIRDFYSQNPATGDKKIILYVPTYRNREAYVAQELKVAFEDASEYKLIISAHPLSKIQIEDKYSYRGDFSTLDLMKVANVVITDYSACAFEASILMKPLYFFIPDYDRYIKERGINIDMKTELPKASFEDADKLLSAIQSDNYDFDALYAFKSKYIENEKANNSEMLAKFISLELK